MCERVCVRVCAHVDVCVCVWKCVCERESGGYPRYPGSPIDHAVVVIEHLQSC